MSVLRDASAFLSSIKNVKTSLPSQSLKCQMHQRLKNTSYPGRKDQKKSSPQLVDGTKKVDLPTPKIRYTLED